MSLVEEMHAAHKERQARLNGTGHSSARQTRLDMEGMIEPLQTCLGVLTTQLEGLLAEFVLIKRRLVEHSALIGKVMTTEADEKPKISEIIDSVCDFYDVTKNDLLSSRRTGDLILPRMVVYHMARHLTGMSFPQIGRRVGGRDHTTALHGANKIMAQLKSDPTLRDDMDVLEVKIGARVMERRFGKL